MVKISVHPLMLLSLDCTSQLPVLPFSPNSTAVWMPMAGALQFPSANVSRREWQPRGPPQKVLHNTFRNKPQNSPSHSALSLLVCILLYAISFSSPLPPPVPHLSDQSPCLPSSRASEKAFLDKDRISPQRHLPQSQSATQRGKMSKLSCLITEINLVI